MAAFVLGGCAAAQPSPGTATPTATASQAAVAGTPTLPDCLTGVPVACYTPGQFRAAYGLTQLLNRGIDGRGETVVLPELAPEPGQQENSDIRQDLALFDQRFGLPLVHLEVTTRLAGAVSPDLAGAEEVGDAEMVHAVAPGATIAVILLPVGQGRAAADFPQMLGLAARLGGVVSVTLGLGERCFTAAGVSKANSALRADQEQDVTVIAASGDEGAAASSCTASAPQEGVNFPASDPLVLAVGGTRLQASRTTGAYQDETSWNDPIPPAEERQLPADAEPPIASGGGFSGLFPRPSYQAGVAGIGAARGVPDVAGDASTYTGMAGMQYVTGGKVLIGPLDGTSAAAPFWAGIIALADQFTGRHLGFVNPAIYRIGRGGSYHRAFHDVTTGTNTVTYPAGTVTGYRAAAGWDPVTGWGSPNAQVLVPLLAAGG